MKVLLIIAAAFLMTVQGGAETPRKVGNFSLPDYNGSMVSLADFKDSKAIVVMFIATKCPVSNAYNKRMEALFEDYAPKHVAFIGINSNKAEAADEVRAHAKEHALKFVILKDAENKIADRFEAGVTPEIFVLNADFDILYHGRIDDSQRENNVTSQDLRTALDEILGGGPVTHAETKAFGCSIKRVE